MLQFFVNRLLQGAVILVLVSFVAFVITLAAPGNALQTFIDPNIPPSELRAAEARLGLDQPAYVQYSRWLGQLLTGNLGYSFRTGRSVADLVGSRIGPTFLLMGTAFAIILALALWLGVITAARPRSALDYGVTGLAFAGISVPSFFTAMALIYVFALRLGWLPTSGLENYAAAYTGWQQVADRARHLVLPVTVLVLTGAAEMVRHVRSAVLEALGQDYVRTARSKGVADRAILLKHALRNSLLPVITLIGVALPRLLAGSVVTEVVFAWPGMGRLLVESVFARDYPVAMAINLLGAVLVLLGSLAADMLYAVADPRVRYS
ncbi:MAG TPA: ABC transporter permease [Trueperaceae bacterium]|nr:ABC transporter permease [Trueperaceae bacterium]